MKWLILVVILVGLGIVIAGSQGQRSPTPAVPDQAITTPTAAPTGGATGNSAHAGSLALGDWTPSSTRSLKILDKEWFRIGYDERMKNPAWVSYAVSGPITFTGREPTRPATFQTDFATSAHVSQHDYSRSGFDRGHMAPAYGNRSSNLI